MSRELPEKFIIIDGINHFIYNFLNNITKSEISEVYELTYSEYKQSNKIDRLLEFFENKFSEVTKDYEIINYKNIWNIYETLIKYHYIIYFNFRIAIPLVNSTEPRLQESEIHFTENVYMTIEAYGKYKFYTEWCSNDTDKLDKISFISGIKRIFNIIHENRLRLYPVEDLTYLTYQPFVNFLEMLWLLEKNIKDKYIFDSFYGNNTRFHVNILNTRVIGFPILLNSKLYKHNKSLIENLIMMNYVKNV